MASPLTGEIFSIANDQIQGTPGDAVRVLLLLECLVQQMVNVAILDSHVLRVHLDSVALTIPDCAVPQHNIVGENAHQVAASMDRSK
jgi:hypothetical protein